MSGTKSNLLPSKILSAADLSAATVTSPVSAVNLQDNLLYQAIITGSPVGTLDVQFSSDYNPKTTNAGTWISLGSTYQATVNGAGNGMIEINQAPAHYVRVLYTKTSGTGNMDLYVSGKQV